LSDELDEELQFHLDARTRDNRRAGMTAESARSDANRRLGNRPLARERAHEANIVVALETLRRDLLYALRGLRNSPGFAIVAILTLALGFGATIAVFTVVNGVLLRPLPFPEPGRLLLVSYQSKDGPFEYRPAMYDKHYLEFERQNRSFEQVATFGDESVTLTGAGEAVRLPAASVTAGFFPVLQVNPALGRAFRVEEEPRGKNHVALLSDKLWRERFAGDPHILGRTMTLDGAGYTVVGVMPPGFEFPAKAELWLPLEVGGDPNNAYDRTVIGRLRPSVSRRQAQAELETIARHIPLGPWENRSSMIAEILPLNDLLVGKVRKSLLIFMGAVAFVLLIACANVANLLLMRGTARQRELGVRNALGASRGRLIRQLLTESTLLSTAGAIAGILLARLGVPILLALAPAGEVPRVESVHLDGGVLAFALGLGVLLGIAFGLVPALQATGGRVRGMMGKSGPALTARRERLRGALVISEIALALVLLTGAGLMLKSFAKMRSVDPGFRTDNVLTMTVDLPDSSYPTAPALQAFQERILEKLQNLPGVTAAGAVNWMPLLPILMEGDFHLEGGRKLPPDYVVAKPAVSPDYFRTMGIRLERGRGFSEQDKGSAPGAVIVSRSVAQTIWPGEDAVGKRIALEDNPKPSDWATIVGVVDDVRQQTLRQEPLPAIYQPMAQVARPLFMNHISFVVRTGEKPQGVAAGLRGVLHQVDKSQPVEIEALSRLVEADTAETGFQARLIAAFSTLALVLAAIGIYGVLAYAVTERTREIGIRMALGANKSDIARMLLGRTLLLVSGGLLIGGCGALALTRLLTRFLFEVKPTDPATFAAVAGILAATGIVAGLLPARRASRVDPVVALRCE
jgi:putative ABC transport system permease protein